MTSNHPDPDDLAALIDDSAARTDPLENHFVMIDGPLVAYTGPGRIGHPWSATEYAVRELYNFEKDRSDGFDAKDPRASNLFAEDESDKVETKAARIGRSKSTGRFAVRDAQHAELVEDGGDYVLITYEQLTDRLIYIGDHVRISADTMDDIVSRYAWSKRDRTGEQESEVRVPWETLPWFDAEKEIRKAFVLDYTS